MSQFDSGFWDVYIALVTVLSIVACAVFLRSQTKAAPPQETTGHVWDEDLAEYNYPLPSWLRQGKDDRVEPLADEMRDTFTRLSLPIEARKAVVFLTVVSEMRLASVPVVERTRDFLARLREDPQLVFDVPTALLG